MKTLTNSCSKAILDRHGDKGFPCFKDLSLHRAELCLIPSKKLVEIRFLSMQHRPLQPVSSSFSLSPDSQVDLETVETQPEEEYPSKTTHVKFRLEKECSFGEHFFLVGDHPMLGLWDPESAIPLNWSEGHVWAVELDIPVGKSIQFKFILKSSTGDLLWQPGPDRIFKSWESENTIVICEDWENAEDQKILEEDPLANQDGAGFDPAMSMVAENLAPQMEELISGTQLVSDADSMGNPEEQPLQAVSEELTTGIGAPSQEKPLTIVADNISDPAKDFMENAKNNGVLGVKRTNYPNDEAYTLSNKNVLVAEDLQNFGIQERVQDSAAADVEGNLVEHEGSPVLVPGLTPLATVSTEKTILDEDEKNNMDDASNGDNGDKYHKQPELHEEQEPESEPQEEKTSAVSKYGEEQVDNQHDPQPEPAREPQPESEHFQSNVFQTDVQWGRKTIQKLLNSLRFL